MRAFPSTFATGSIGALLAAAAAACGCATWLQVTTARYVYSAEAVPTAPGAVVLGALVHPGGTPSAVLRGRLDVARRLYRTGKVRTILVSGTLASTPSG